MHRFFVPPESFQNDELIVHGDYAHRIKDVLRLDPGEVIAAVDDKGAEYRVELTRVARGAVRGRVLNRVYTTREPRTHLALYQSLLKADKFEWVLQKGTEIGISEFVPISSSRASVDSPGRAKRARWERIIIEAAEQSGRSKIPTLVGVQTFDDALKDAEGRGGLGLIPWEEERIGNLRPLLEGLEEGSPISFFIGPEGGFAAEEIDAARTHGFHPVSLGPRILRAETASLVAASAILFVRGELDASRMTDSTPQLRTA